jgi:hypothetical protein
MVALGDVRSTNRSGQKRLGKQSDEARLNRPIDAQRLPAKIGAEDTGETPAVRQFKVAELGTPWIQFYEVRNARRIDHEIQAEETGQLQLGCN